jgi:hypothetical protein
MFAKPTQHKKTDSKSKTQSLYPQFITNIMNNTQTAMEHNTPNTNHNVTTHHTTNYGSMILGNTNNGND